MALSGEAYEGLPVERQSEAATSMENAGPMANKTNSIRKKVLTFSTCSVVKGPPYLSLAKSSLEGM